MSKKRDPKTPQERRSEGIPEILNRYSPKDPSEIPTARNSGAANRRLGQPADRVAAHRSRRLMAAQLLNAVAAARIMWLMFREERKT